MSIILRILFTLLLVGLPSIAECLDPVKVTINGIEGNLAKSALAALTIDQRKTQPHLTEELVRRLHDKGSGEIAKALQPFGYYGPSIKGTLNQSDGVWQAIYTVEPGKPVQVEEVDLRIEGPGKDNENLKRVVDDFPLKEGDTLNHPQYEKGKRNLQRTALNQGYLDALLTAHRVEVFPSEHRARIFLHLETGPQYRFGPVTFNQDVFREEFLGRFVPFEPGAPYAQSDLFKLQNALYDGGYFQNVNVRPLADDADDLSIPIEVSLVPRKRHQYTAGIGFGTDSGLRGSLGWESRRINAWGHRMDAEAKLSQINQNFTTQYTVPLKNPVLENRTYTAGWLKEDTDTNESETWLVGASHHHLRGKWKETLYLNYQSERFQVGEDRGRSQLLLPGVRWSRVKADDRIYATRGSRFLLDIRGALDALLSDTSFLQLRALTKVIRNLGPSGRILIRGEAATSLIDEFSQVPASLRFYAGGDQSVRGYDYRELGPVDDNGDVVGGKHLLVGSFEYEHRLLKNWSVAAFVDTGNAIDDWSDSLKTGAGIGLRWLSPIGPVRLDVASALDKDGKPWRLHFVVGPDL
ncbi:MAG: autotransporter assembly complex family protein [bacterium]|nr:autotransporter assembly complex family protein [bacterium]